MAKRTKIKVLELSPKQELFCQLYVLDKQFRGNATWCYVEAYEVDLASKDRTNLKDEQGKDIPGSSEYARAYHVCEQQGYTQLRKTEIRKRLVTLLNEYVDDTVVDSRLRDIILNADHGDSVAAIREYNKLKARIIEKQDITSGGEPLKINLTDAHTDK